MPSSIFAPTKIMTTSVWALVIAIVASATGECTAKPQDASKKPAVQETPNSETTAVDQDELTQGRPYEYETKRNIFFDKKESYQLLCDLYLPQGSGPFPCVLAIHGGAWKYGDKLSMLRHAQRLATAGYVVVSINYRLAPEYQFPAQIHDCKQAVRWIRSKAKKLKIDPEQVFAFGYSAGGHLAAMLGVTRPEDGLEGDVADELKPFSSQVQGVIAGGAPCDFSWIKSDAISDWLGDSPQNNPELYRKAAPLSYVTAKAAPFLFVHGVDDSVVPLKASQKMHQRLLENDVTTTYKTIDHCGHALTFSDLSWIEDITQFVDENRKQK